MTRKLPTPARSRAAASACAASSRPRWLLVMAFLVLGVLFAVFVYMLLNLLYPVPSARALAERFAEDPAKGPAAAPASATLVFVHMDGCSWCTKFKPVWAELQEKHSDRLKALGVTLASYERKDPAVKAYDSYVKGYPTILLDKKSSVVVFDGDRTVEGLMAFLEENVSAARK